MTRGDFLNQLKKQALLSKYTVPEREIEDLFCHCLNISWGDLFLDRALTLKPEEKEAIQSFYADLFKGVPLAYILGYKDFYKYQFHVSPEVLIPRPDSEVLVRACLETLTVKEPTILDLGAGSGCLGLSIALDCPGSELTLIEASTKALAVCEKNCRDLQFAHANILHFKIDETPTLKEFLKSSFDLVIANPPYIPHDDPALDPRVRDFEPHEALFSDEQGLHHWLQWARQAREVLNPEGLLAFEMGYQQMDLALSRIGDLGLKPQKVYEDGAGHRRFIIMNLLA